MIKNYTIAALFFLLMISCTSNPAANKSPDKADSIVSRPEDKVSNTDWTTGPEPENIYQYNIAVATSEDLLPCRVFQLYSFIAVSHNPALWAEWTRR